MYLSNEYNIYAAKDGFHRTDIDIEGPLQDVRYHKVSEFEIRWPTADDMHEIGSRWASPKKCWHHGC